VNSREDARSVDSLALTVKVLVAHAGGVVIAAVGITVPVEALIRVGTATTSTNILLADMVRIMAEPAAVGVKANA
jgi:hypothetical protein